MGFVRYLLLRLCTYFRLRASLGWLASPSRPRFLDHSHPFSIASYFFSFWKSRRVFYKTRSACSTIGWLKRGAKVSQRQRKWEDSTVRPARTKQRPKSSVGKKMFEFRGTTTTTVNTFYEHSVSECISEGHKKNSHKKIDIEQSITHDMHKCFCSLLCTSILRRATATAVSVQSTLLLLCVLADYFCVVSSSSAYIYTWSVAGRGAALSNSSFSHLSTVSSSYKSRTRPRSDSFPASWRRMKGVSTALFSAPPLKLWDCSSNGISSLSAHQLCAGYLDSNEECRRHDGKKAGTGRGSTLLGGIRNYLKIDDEGCCREQGWCRESEKWREETGGLARARERVGATSRDEKLSTRG